MSLDYNEYIVKCSTFFMENGRMNRQSHEHRKLLHIKFNHCIFVKIGTMGWESHPHNISFL